MTSAEQNLEVDTAFEADSTLGTVDDQLSAFSQSLTSSVTAYPVEHGRRYHAYKDGSYLMPNDEMEQDRLDIMHNMLMRLLDNQHFFAPIPEDKLKRVLDVGTGTGIWAIEMADKYPNAQILGNDLSPVQPSWVPPNVKFEVDDVEAPWTHATPFDLIYMRYMAGSLTSWPALFRNAFAATRPGGWIEVHDFDTIYRSDDGTLPASAQIHRFVAALVEGCGRMGKDVLPGPKIEGWVKDAGFVNVSVRTYKVPLGPWAKDERMKEVGLLNLMQVLEGLEAFSYRVFTGVLGWELEEVQVLNAKVKEEIKGRAHHAYYTLYVVCGQRPEESGGDA